jgi:lipopolysaccharide exporter
MTQSEPEAPSINSRVVASTGWVIAWRAVTRNLGLISTLVLVRLLEPSDFGLVALGTAFAATVDALSAFGVQDALIRLPSPSRVSYDTAFGLGLLRGLLTTLVIAGGAWPTAVFFNEPRLSIVLLALAAGTLITAFENIGTVDFRRHMTFQKEFNLQVGPRIIGVALTISIALIWHNYWALVGGILTTRIARLVQSYVMSSYRPRFTLRAWRGLIGFSLWNWAVNLLSQIRERADSFVIGRAFTTTEVAVFSVGQEIGSLPVTELIEPMHRALFSAFALLNNTSESPRTLYLNMMEAGFLVLLPAGIGISIVADPLVHLMLGERWLTAIPVVQIIAAVSTISVFRLISDAFYSAAGNLRMTFVLTAVSALLRIPLLLVLVAWYGLPGAAIALGISSMVDQTLYLRVTLPRLGIKLVDLLRRLWRALGACLAMIACLGASGMAWTPTTATGSLAMALDMLSRSGVGMVVYVVALVALWLAAGQPDGAERQLLRIIRNLCGKLRIPGLLQF